MFMKRIFLVHGWTGRPNKDFFPWVKEKLQNEGYQVFVPELPEPDYPKIKPWVEKIKEVVNKPQENDILIGHSLGCMGIFQYLQTLPNNTKVNKVILIAGFEKLKNAAFDALEDCDTFKPWREAPINYKKIKRMAKSWIALFSDNDPFVSYEDNSEVFKDKLDTKIILVHKKSHFNQEAGIKTLPILIKLIK